MPHRCTVCRRPNRAEIDKAILAGGTVRDIARRYGASRPSVDRHKRKCLAAELVKAEEIKHEDLLAEIRDLKKRLWRGLSQVEAEGNRPAFIAYCREVRATVDQIINLREKGMGQREVKLSIVYERARPPSTSKPSATRSAFAPTPKKTHQQATLPASMWTSLCPRSSNTHLSLSSRLKSSHPSSRHARHHRHSFQQPPHQWKLKRHPACPPIGARSWAAGRSCKQRPQVAKKTLRHPWSRNFFSCAQGWRKRVSRRRGVFPLVRRSRQRLSRR